MHTSRRSAIGMIGGAGLGALAAACVPAVGTPSAAITPSNTTPAGGRTGPSFDPIVANSELVVGPNRFAMGLIGEGGRPITDAAVTFGFFQVAGQQATKVSEAEAVFRWVDVETKGVYTAPVIFTPGGSWGVEVAVARPGRAGETARVQIDVHEIGRAPMIGSTPPRLHAAGPDEPCSNVPPCELHAVGLDDALASGRPAAILFASPGFCMTATCAPMLGIVNQLRVRQAGRTNFVHVEIYKDPRNLVVADAVNRWNLPSEPWIFLVDSRGLIVDRYEGIATLDELEPPMRQLA